MSNHTPTPWKLDDIGYGARINPDIAWVGYGSAHDNKTHRANAEFIVRACNSHYDLLEALQKAVSRQGFTNAELIAARDAIAKATGEKP